MTLAAILERLQSADGYPAPPASESWQQNALPRHKISKEQVRSNLARVRTLIGQAVPQTHPHENAAKEKRCAALREQARHWEQLEQTARDLKACGTSAPFSEHAESV